MHIIASMRTAKGYFEENCPYIHPRKGYIRLASLDMNPVMPLLMSVQTLKRNEHFQDT